MLAKLKDGFEVTVKNEILDDWEFLELLNEIDEGNGSKIVNVARAMLGEEEVGKLKEHFKEKTGKVTVNEMVEAITELLESIGEAKNS